MKICIIPAAGKSTRLKELGKHYPKTVLPYKGEPIICHIIRDVQKLNPDLIIIGVNNETAKNQIEFATRKFQGVLVHQFDDSYGVVGPARSLHETLDAAPEGDHEVICHLSDSLFKIPDEIRFGKDFIGYGVTDEDFRRWCFIDDDGKFYDKPQVQPPTNHYVSGIYGFKSSSEFRKSYSTEFVYIRERNEFQISTVLKHYSIKNPFQKIECPIYKDFGTLEDYLKERGISQSRSFNHIEDLGKSVIKSSRVYPEKIAAEGFFIQNQPYYLKEYYPAIHEVDAFTGEYTMEKIRSTNLRDVYLFLDRSEETWSEIFRAVGQFTNECIFTNKEYSTCFWDKLFEKNKSRLSSWWDNPASRKFLDELESEIRASRVYQETTRFHGDLHFANMFYCFTYKELKLIDPRGDFRGHYLYDFAKLYHSAVGKYDWIDAELYDEDGFFDAGSDGVVRAFESWVGDVLTSEEISLMKMISASLFLTMIPLHDHNEKNQHLFYEEFLRLRDL